MGGGGGGKGGVRFRSEIRKVGGGVAIRFRSDTKSGECDPLQVRDTKSGGGAVRFRSDAFVWHTENTLSLINGYNFDRGGCSSTRSTPPGYATVSHHLIV